MWMVQTSNAYIVVGWHCMMWLVIVGGERVMSVLCRPMCVPCCLNVRKSSMYDNPRIGTVIGAVASSVRLSHVGFKCGTRIVPP